MRSPRTLQPLALDATWLAPEQRDLLGGDRHRRAVLGGLARDDAPAAEAPAAEAPKTWAPEALKQTKEQKEELAAAEAET